MLGRRRFSSTYPTARARVGAERSKLNLERKVRIPPDAIPEGMLNQAGLSQRRKIGTRR